MVRNDRPSFSTWFPLHLERLMPLLDHLYVRIDKTGDDVISYLEPYGDKVHWDWQYDHPHDNHLEDYERQAILNWGLSTGAKWMACFDSDEVLEQGAAELLRDFIAQEPGYRILMFPLTYSSHHREGYVLNRDETSVSAARMFRLDDEELKTWRYKGDSDGLHCGTLPGQERRSTAIFKELITVHYHATTPEEWDQKRAFYAGTEEVAKFFPDGAVGAYPLCGEPPYHCDRFGKEANAVPLEDVLVNREQRFATLMARLDRKPKDAVNVNGVLVQ